MATKTYDTDVSVVGKVTQSGTPSASGDLITKSHGDANYKSVSVTLNSQTGTTYTLVLSDAGKYVRMNNAAANTLTIPPNSSVAFPVGTYIEVAQVGAGQTAIAPGSGVTLNSANSYRKISVQYGGVGLYKVATDTWELIGSLTA